jgi:Flp pilus assembly protein TadD
MTRWLDRAERLASGRLAPVLVGALGFLVFVRTLGYGFVYDDGRQVLENPWIWSPRYLPDLLFKPVWAFVDGGPSNFYRPVQTLVHFCAAMLFGRGPIGFHLLSVMMHALASAAALLFLRRITGPLRALLAASLFAAWPIHAEPVAWVSAGPDVNAALFLFLCFWLCCAVRSGASSERSPVLLLLLAGAAFFLALLSKETALAAPLLALALPQPRRSESPVPSPPRQAAGPARAALAFGCVFGLPLAVYLVLRTRAVGGLLPTTARAALSGAEGWGTALMLLPRYVALAFLPWRVVPDRVVTPTGSPLAPAALFGAAVAAGLLAAWVWLRRRSPPAAFGVAILVVPLLPALQVRYFTGILQADRYLYIPSLGACLLISEAAGGLFLRAGAPAVRALLAAGCSCLVLLAAGRTVIVADIWRDSATLGRKGIALEPRSITMRLELISALDRKGETDEALKVALEAKHLAPEDPRASAAVAALRARAAAAGGGDPIAIYREALAADPYRAHLWVGLSAALLRAGRPQEAIEAAERAIALDQFNRAAHVNLGTARGALGDFAGQEREARRLLEFDPRSAEGFMNLGAARLGQDDPDGAREALLQASDLDPNLARVEYYLSWIASRRGESEEALRRARRATEIDATDDEAWNRLGVTLAASGDREGARRAWEKAIALRPGNEQARGNLQRLATAPPQE